MKFAAATESYESWLGGHVRLVQRDLTLKHERMRSGSFEFLRATFYRWAQTWRDVCGDAAAGPEVLSVGDLHIEDSGTWRDAEGRLVWGVNDFDEAWFLPFSSDLIRLATSACIARLSCDAKACAAAILEGYTESIAAGGHCRMEGRPYRAGGQGPRAFRLRVGGKSGRSADLLSGNPRTCGTVPRPVRARR